MGSDHHKSVERLLNVAAQALKDAAKIARDHSISFVWSRAPFEAKYKADIDKWEVGSDYWNDSGCTIDMEEFESSDWESSSALC